MSNLSDDVCYLHYEGEEWAEKEDYYKAVKVLNDLLIDINNPLIVFDPAEIIDIFNIRLNLESCTFCKFKVEYRKFGPVIILYGNNDEGINIFEEFCKYYNGENDNCYLQKKGTVNYSPQVPNMKSNLRSLRYSYCEYDSCDIVYKLVLDYYRVYDWLKKVLIEEIEQQLETSFDHAIQDICDCEWRNKIFKHNMDKIRRIKDNKEINNYNNKINKNYRSYY